MTISIITVVYNDKDGVNKTIQSVLGQRYPNVEYIIIDGGSTDGTIDVIKKYSDRISFWISEPDEGMYDALNKGISHASGDWIGIMNAGDYFNDACVLSDIFKDPVDEEVGVLYGNSYILSKGNKILLKSHSPNINSIIPPEYRHGASFIRTNIHKQFMFDVSQKNKYDYGLDYLQIFTMYRNGVKFEYRDVTILVYPKEGMSNHVLKSKYLRTLTINDGVVDFTFLIKFGKELLNALGRKIIRRN